MKAPTAPATLLWRPIRPGWIPTPALVADIELASAIPPLRLDASQRVARILVRLYGRPIGYADIQAAPAELIDLPHILSALDPNAEARLRRHLAAGRAAHGLPALPAALPLSEALAQVAPPPLASPLAAAAYQPVVTVAICTRDRSDTLGATLDSLLCQTYNNTNILVIDNAPSDDATARLVQEHYPTVRYVLEERPGLDCARNRAACEAQGEFLAFIDDDATADPAWVAALVAAFDAPDVMCVTGLVAPARLDTPAQELFERFGYSKGFERVRFSLDNPPPYPGFPYKGYLGTGCNSAFRRSVFAFVGLFDPRFDMGTPIPGGGDHDMFARIVKAGYTLVYDPCPVVFHNHIADLAVLSHKLGQYQCAFSAYLTKHILADRIYALPLLAHLSWWYTRKTVRGLVAALIKKDRPLALVFSQAGNFWLGPVAFYRSHRVTRYYEVHTLPYLTLPAAASPEVAGDEVIIEGNRI